MIWKIEITWWILSLQTCGIKHRRQQQSTQRFKQERTVNKCVDDNEYVHKPMYYCSI